ncbi:MAG TPA: MBL fold metallo-hydrolase [Chloroflexia bacterium]|nr:MBL fold metallo-hydrolase [Chloroflexia bacterium]
MIIERITSGPVDTNSYLVADAAGGEAMIVDAPIGSSAALLQRVAALGVRVVRIVNTHGHWDHIGDNAALVAATGAPLLVHAADAERLARPESTLLRLPYTIPPSTPTVLLQEGDVLALGPTSFTVWHTPGHTPGSCCLYAEAADLLFSGDTLFDQGMGRTDLPGGDEVQLYASLRRLADLAPTTRFYPGHGPDSTIEDQGWMLRLGWGI